MSVRGPGLSARLNSHFWDAQMLHEKRVRARTASLGCVREREGRHYLTGLNAPLLFPPPEKLPRANTAQEINSHSLVLSMFGGMMRTGWEGRGQAHSSRPTCALTLPQEVLSKVPFFLSFFIITIFFLICTPRSSS